MKQLRDPTQIDSGLIYIDAEIGDAETEGPEFSSGSIRHDIFGYFVVAAGFSLRLLPPDL